MCIRDRREKIVAAASARMVVITDETKEVATLGRFPLPVEVCLLYTSDAADERSSVDLGGRRIIKKKTHRQVCDK